MSDISRFSPIRALDRDGYPVPGALATFFLSGTTTPQVVYADQALTIAHPVPLEADATGTFPQVFSAVAIKTIMTDPDGVVLPGYPMDPTPRLATGSGASQVSFSPTADIPAVNVQQAIEQLTAQIAASGQVTRNLIINGSGRVNQDGYVSGTATTAANQFTLDNWFVITSGQNLTFTGNASRRVMTAPAGGVSQVIESVNILGTGTYVINWDGTATCTVGGTARDKGDTFTLTPNTNVTVTFTGGTFTDVQVERATSPSPFEFRSIAQELALCQRYYAIVDGEFGHDGVLNPASAGGVTVGHTWFLPVKMRATPSVSVVNESSTQAGDIGGLSAKSGDAIFATWQWLNANVVTSRRKAAILAADARLTS